MKACFAQFPVSYTALFYISTNTTRISPYTQFSTLDNLNHSHYCQRCLNTNTDFSEDKSEGLAVMRVFPYLLEKFHLRHDTAFFLHILKITDLSLSYIKIPHSSWLKLNMAVWLSDEMGKMNINCKL